MVINYIFRKKGDGHNSIEELFHSIIRNLSDDIEANVIELPYAGASISSIFKNIIFLSSLKGIIHITGDVYYIGLIPFKKTILTIHDINFIKGSYLKRVLLKLFWLIIPSILVRRITVVSEFSKNELLKFVPWAKSKIRVIHNPVNPQFETMLKEFKIPPIILHIGTKSNKNLINTIKGLSGIKCNLIIVGPLDQQQKNCLLIYKIQYVNYFGISFEELKILYEKSDIVSFISLYEGFGMPIIEAQKVGRVVITTKRAAIPEISNDAAYFVDPVNKEEIRSGFKSLIKDFELKDELIIKGLENVKRFEMSPILNNYKALYAEIS